MSDIFLAKRVIDYVGLGARNIPERNLGLFKDLQPVLALLQAMGQDGAKLLSVDLAGNLQVTLAGETTRSAINVSQWGNQLVGGSFADLDAAGPFNGPPVNALQFLYNGATRDRGRSASAANLAALSSLGAALTASPGQWSLTSAPAAGTQATATRAAGGAGVRHVCTGFGFGFSANVAPAAQSFLVTLRDGATGAGTVLRSWIFDIPAAIIAPFSIEVGGFQIVGSAATAMTMEFAGGIASLHEYVNLSGYDAV